MRIRPPAGFMDRQTSSFADFLSSHSPDLLPGRAPGGGPDSPALRDLPHATTIIAAVCHHGVVLAGDRRATAGSMIAKRDVEKVFRSDGFSAIGYAGTGSVGIELVRLFPAERSKKRKMEGAIVVPPFVCYDEGAGQGRIFSYDVAGGPYEEQRFHSIGSGSVFARGSMKKLYVDDMSVSDAVLACVQALYDAADDDSATGGPDLTRRIFPVIATVTADGFRKLPEAESEDYAQQVVQERMTTPDGPSAPLRPAR